MSNPIKPTLKSEVLPLLLIALSFAAAFYFYPRFPAQVVTHWDFAGQANGWSSARFAAFFFPFLNLGMYLLLLFIPYLDPKKASYQDFRSAYHVIKNFLIFFLVVIYLITGLNNLGYNLPINRYVPMLVGLLFIIIGNYMGKLKSNWFIGMRNPWTLSSETVWNKTNRLTGKLFMFAGLLLIFTGFVPEPIKLPLFILTITALILVPNVYSFILYKKEKMN